MDNHLHESVYLQKRQNIVPYFVYIIIGTALLVIIFFISLMVGQYNMTLLQAIKTLFGNAESLTHTIIIFELRLPRTMVACLVGIALSISGLIYQIAFQNELVSPDILGVSSGASVGVAAGLLFGLPLLLISGLGFVFGACAMLLTLCIARVFKNKSPIMLVIAGILVSGLMGSIVSLIKAWADTDTVLPAIVYWLLGSFASIKMIHFWILLPIVVSCIVFLFIISRKFLNNMVLGLENAKTRGINYKLWRAVVLFVGTILTASAVSVAGTIGWVGLVIPYMTRLLVGHQTQKCIPMATIFGGAFMMFVDIFARTLTNSEIPVGAIAGIVGIAIFILILSVQRGQNYVFD